MTEHVEDHTSSQYPPADQQRHDTDIDNILNDSTKCAEILRKLGLPDPSDLTPSGKATGGGGLPLPSQMWFPFPMFSPWNPQAGPHMAGPSQHVTLSLSDNGGSEKDNHQDEDVVDLLDDNEALELMEFDPSVDAPTTWTPLEAMTSFLEKHFNRCLADSEREEILNDFPKPNTPVLNAPKLDEDVVDQLKSKGKDPHFGQERVLFKLQEALLDVSGPLMCLWADLTNLC